MERGSRYVDGTIGVHVRHLRPDTYIGLHVLIYQLVHLPAVAVHPPRVLLTEAFNIFLDAFSIER